MREGKCRTHMPSELRAVVRGAEQVDRRQRYVRWHRADIVKRMAGRKAAGLQQHQFVEAVEEIVLIAYALSAPKRIGRCRVGAGRAAQAEIDTAGVERLQHLEALSHH